MKPCNSNVWVAGSLFYNMINGFIVSYDIRLVDVLVNDNLKWKNLETSRSLVMLP